MPLITFPNALTEEEEILKQKFALLRKKKKQLHALRNTKQELQQKLQDSVKRPPESAEEATEQAKKLVQSGAIKLGHGSKEKIGFKRSKLMEKKLKEVGPSVGFQPFSPQHGDEDDKPESPVPNKKQLYQSFVRAESKYDGDGRRDREWEDRRERDDRRDRTAPKHGNTVYVNGQGIREDMLRTAFSNFGEIAQLNMEPERHNAFITFKKMESADQAVEELNGSVIGNIQLKVAIARRQPTFENIVDPSTEAWAAIAADQSQKGPARRDDRNVLIYDSDDMFEDSSAT